MSNNDLRQKTRKRHSYMAYDAASSYAIMTKSGIYQKSHSIYFKLIREMINKLGLKNIEILNIGTAGGYLEYSLLTKLHKYIKFVSIDNSDDFLNIAKNQNEDFQNRGLIKFKKNDVEREKIDLGKYDIVISRDVNHHILNLNTYIKNSYDALSDKGLFVIEDLMQDAVIGSIKSFIELVFEVPEFKNDSWLLLNKLLGLIESFMSAYTVEDIENVLSQFSKLHWIKTSSSSRYFFLISKDKTILEKLDNIIDQYK